MTIRPIDAWKLARLVAGKTADGELQALPWPFRGVAEHLATLPVAERSAAFAGFLSGRDDASRIVKALTEVDPTGPPPEPAPPVDDEVPDAWPPLRLGELPPAEPFPVGVLPAAAAALVLEGAEAIGCPPDFLALPALAVAAGAIGRSVALMLKPGYFAPASIYGACVGPPSDGKTPRPQGRGRRCPPDRPCTGGSIRCRPRTLGRRCQANRTRWQEARARPAAPTPADRRR